ncbi:7-cyano-7-deazaguanine synthase [Mucilaginibacter daejeonensis]|uniref:7-cyano-7-deazaguanine synthase n=1 Tax=Mucilaginibacter daejeonensis TaxID=398049 RepID=UPI001D172BE7|nr:7-cyano-7-deazaguanine synthase [Mucilaginibacter daejeonensis]UEG51394.1 7-cyano-7-deazaguanine synthase [Mucilaginibacter daejeonensis]
MRKAILLSGGLDSVSLAYWKRPNIAISLDYGQAAAKKELEVSGIIAHELGMTHEVITIDCSSLGSGDLINGSAVVGSPSPEWWPYRNQLLVTLACMKGISLGLDELMVGSVKSDGFHKDGTAGFYERINDLMQYQEGHIQIVAPAIELSSVELIQISGIPNSLLHWAHSCHTGDVACGKCRGCQKYQYTFRTLNAER